jgi:hypothetical protein
MIDRFVAGPEAAQNFDILVGARVPFVVRKVGATMASLDPDGTFAEC